MNDNNSGSVRPQTNSVTGTTSQGVTNSNVNPMNNSGMTPNRITMNPQMNSTSSSSTVSNSAVRPQTNNVTGTTSQGVTNSNVNPMNNSGMTPNRITMNPQMNSTSSSSTVSNSAVRPQTNNITGDHYSQAGIPPINSTNNQSIMSSNQRIVDNTLINQNFSTVNQTNNEELLKSFIGNNYGKITTKPFNFAGFFFTTFYMFYRKMFGYALLVFLIDIIILNVIKISAVTLVFNVLVGLFVNKIYLFYANKKITKLKLQNPQKNTEELKKICAAKGGTSVGSIFLGFIVELALAIILLITLSIFGVASAFSNLFSNFGNQVNSSLNGTYEGVIMTNTSINMANEFSISVPSKFEDESDQYSYEYSYSSGNGVFDKCKFYLSVPSGFSDAKNLINQMSSYDENDNPIEVTKSSINGINWYWFSKEDAFGKVYYYGTTKNNKVFLLEYDVNEDASSDCENYRHQIIESIKSK